MARAKRTCPSCGTISAASVGGPLRCPSCNGLLDSEATVTVGEPNPQAGHATTTQNKATAGTWRAAKSYDEIVPGSLIGDRYEVLEVLGAGGMGAVYKVHDREVDRVAALKVIRPEMADNPEILRMFKQELILARQVTHRNVIRIYDLGVADGLRFITMQFVEGLDLRTILKEKGKLAPEEATAVIVQVCDGLHAAHHEKVVHRDLKPANIMIDGENRALVMDFGLAHTEDSGGNRDKLLGTPQYMSPEQASRVEVDARSDIFSVGIIFYELLLGERPFDGKDMRETLQRRIQAKPFKGDDLPPDIPKALREVIAKCLAVDKTLRYQSAADIVRDLQIWQGVLVPGNTRLWRRLSIGFAVTLVAAAGLGLRAYLTRPVPPPKPVTVLIADFMNETGEPVLSGTLEPLVAVAMEEASFINNYPRPQALSVAGQIQPGMRRLDETTARLVAQREGLNVVVSATIVKAGSGYSVRLKALDAVTGNALAEPEVKAPTKDRLLASVAGMAQPVRKALGDRTPSASRAQAGETFTTTSLEAAHDYSLGQEAQLSGKYEEAIKYYQQAVARDPNMARAYSGMAVVHRNRGEEEQAEENIKIALTKPGMSQRERYRIRGASYVIAGSYELAADEYKALLEQFPADNAGRANLAIAYLYLRNLPEAVAQARKAIEIYPRNVAQRNNLASFLLYAGKFDDALKEADAAIRLNPSFDRAYVVKAVGALVAGRTDQALEAYAQAGRAGARGASLAAMGNADIALFEGRTSDAVSLLRAGIQADLEAGQKGRAAAKQVLLARAQLQQGLSAAAAVSAQEALKSTKDSDILQLAAKVLVEAGDEAAARDVARILGKRLDRVPQGQAKVIEGEIALKKGQAAEAIRILRDAQKLVDTWIGRLELGRAYLAAEAFTEADAEFDACLRRRGEAASLTLDLQPTFSYVPEVYFYAGLAQAGIGRPTSAELFSSFLAMRSKAGPADPMVQQARKRTGK